MIFRASSKAHPDGIEQVDRMVFNPQSARALMQKQINRQVETAGLSVFEFAGKRCDRMTESVLVRIGARVAAGDQDLLH